MTIYIKELKQSFKSLCIWTASIAFMMLVCVLLFPEMKGEMDGDIKVGEEFELDWFLIFIFQAFGSSGIYLFIGITLSLTII